MANRRSCDLAIAAAVAIRVFADNGNAPFVLSAKSLAARWARAKNEEIGGLCVRDEPSRGGGPARANGANIEGASNQISLRMTLRDPRTGIR